jgi:hypothetical protein
MPDNVQITAGSGTTIATDQVGSNHYQLIKLAFGPLDTATLVAAAAGLPVDVQNASIAVTGTFWQATQPVSLASLPALAAGTNNIGDVDVLTLPSLPAGGNVIGSVTQSGTWNVGTVTDASVQGKAAHDAAVTGNPLLAGGFASAAAPTAVSADGDVVRAWYLRNGAAATALTASGALVGGDAANGLDVDVTRLPAIPAGTNLIGQVVAADNSDILYSGTTALTPKYAFVNATAPGNTVVVAAVAGKKIRVLRWQASANSATTVRFRSGSTEISPAYYFAQYKDGGGSYCPVGHFETAANTALNVDLSVAGTVGVAVVYVEV